MMRVFARVAQRGSFTAAAEDLRMSRASVTKHVAAIEEQHSVRLLDRTTRSVSMTEAGRGYLERCLECLQAFDDAEASLQMRQVLVVMAEDQAGGLVVVEGELDLRAGQALARQRLVAAPAALGSRVELIGLGQCLCLHWE